MTFFKDCYKQHVQIEVRDILEGWVKMKYTEMWGRPSSASMNNKGWSTNQMYCVTMQNMFTICNKHHPCQSCWFDLKNLNNKIIDNKKNVMFPNIKLNEDINYGVISSTRPTNRDLCPHMLVTYCFECGGNHHVIDCLTVHEGCDYFIFINMWDTRHIGKVSWE